MAFARFCAAPLRICIFNMNCRVSTFLAAPVTLCMILIVLGITLTAGRLQVSSQDFIKDMEIQYHTRYFPFELTFKILADPIRSHCHLYYSSANLGVLHAINAICGLTSFIPSSSLFQCLLPSLSVIFTQMILAPGANSYTKMFGSIFWLTGGIQCRCMNGPAYTMLETDAFPDMTKNISKSILIWGL